MAKRPTKKKPARAAKRQPAPRSNRAQENTALKEAQQTAHDAQRRLDTVVQKVGGMVDGKPTNHETLEARLDQLLELEASS